MVERGGVGWGEGRTGQTKNHSVGRAWIFLSNNAIYMPNSISLRPMKLLFPYSGILQPSLPPLL